MRVSGRTRFTVTTCASLALLGAVPLAAGASATTSDDWVVQIESDPGEGQILQYVLYDSFEKLLANEATGVPTSSLGSQILPTASTTGLMAPPADSDGDGVPDLTDQCPGEDDTLDVDIDGIPDCIDPLIDSDGDGVADDDDACPDTVLPDLATRRLLPNHYETIDADGDGTYEWVGPDGQVAATLQDTVGCSLSQIAPDAVPDRAYLRFGVTPAQLTAWARLAAN